MAYNISIITGDGIGPEISDVCLNVLYTIRDKFNITNASEASFSIDKNILGGIKIRIGNKIIDGSISTKLNKIKRALTSI